MYMDQQFSKKGKTMKAIINNKLWKTENKSYFRVTPEGIIPMTIDETKEYLGVRDADAYIKEFGAVEFA